MDLEVLKQEIEEQTEMRIGLRYKIIHRGKIGVEQEGQKSQVRAIHVELDLVSFSYNFRRLLLIYEQSITDFLNGRRIRF